MRTFTPNLANYMSLGVGALGALLNGKGQISVSARIRLATASAGVNDNTILSVIINGVAIGLVLNVNGTGPYVRISARSVVGDTRAFFDGAGPLALGVPMFVGGIVDIPAEQIAIYAGGQMEAHGTVTGGPFANATWTFGTPTAADTIGGYKAPPTATTDQFDGDIGEIAIWGTALLDDDFAALNTGTLASAIQPGSLLYYLPIAGVTSPEPPTVGSPVGTITGSLPRADVFQAAYARQANQFLSGVNS